ncbi:hypothetical protein GPUN_0717 [Glaciecola punicea ACAM 611]|uniref:Uncharacterized protein n=1 Tax=Glaciecola punicea ACAM 611 TaxID=1121923 RepID=H5T979_9ALTE|nr:hypothetical protein [Glaciecola punicea]OFA31724.1 hypothetical protein BAE46_08505 [Glaciecola punicea]GAB54856.1 hypothetical protein GPUN_0717 [Glaciecola punicea ACAM 611]
MNITIASLAFITSLTNVSALPGSTNEVVPTQTSKISKIEIVQIIEAEQKANKELSKFYVSLPNMTIEKTLFEPKTASIRVKRTTFFTNRKTESSDE